MVRPETEHNRLPPHIAGDIVKWIPGKRSVSMQWFDGSKYRWKVKKLPETATQDELQSLCDEAVEEMMDFRNKKHVDQDKEGTEDSVS